jgi:hypothetical protein
MAPIGFFRLTLLLPLAVPAFAWLFTPNMLANIIVLSVVVAGIPYLLFAAWMWFALGRSPGTLTVPGLILLAPLLFLPLQAFAWLAWSAYMNGFGEGLIGAAFAFLPFVFFIIVFGYTYVVLAILAFHFLTHAGYVRLDETP